jgi:hypothetical protein
MDRKHWCINVTASTGMEKMSRKKKASGTFRSLW